MYYKCMLEYFREFIDDEGFVEYEEEPTEIELGRFKNKNIAFSFANSFTISKLDEFGFDGEYDVITVIVKKNNKKIIEGMRCLE